MEDFARTSEMIRLKDKFEDKFVLLLVKRLSTKFQQNDFIWHILYIVFLQVIMRLKNLGESLK